jgi:ribosomal protein S27E
MLETLDRTPEMAARRRERRVSTPVACQSCGETLAHQQDGRLLTYRVYATVRRSGRVTLTCPQCRARTDVQVRAS